MKNIFTLLLMIIFFHFIHLQKLEIDVRVTQLISKEVTYKGYLFLQTDGVCIPEYYEKQPDKFDLSVVNEEDESTTSLTCFFYQFRDFFGPAKIACETSNIKVGKYRIVPLEETKSIFYHEKFIVNIFPFSIEETFEMINADDLYFYNIKAIEAVIDDVSKSKKIGFDLFERITTEKKFTIYLGDTPLNCGASDDKMGCLITPSEFLQKNRYESYNVYIMDNKGNKKLNYFTLPIDVVMKYIEKTTLKIKVSKLLTNCLTNDDYIVFDTSDNNLETILFAKNEFLLKVKKEGSSELQELACSFHKHPGETTKILCFAKGKLEEGYYTFEEYISDGPLDDDNDHFSRKYKIIIPSFKPADKFYYSPTGDGEMIFDGQLREKIELNFQNKEEILNITLNAEKFQDDYKYFIGNYQIKLSKVEIGQKSIYVICEVKGSYFESSGLYYLEKMNILGKRERLYHIPPIDVKVSWKN